MVHTSRGNRNRHARPSGKEVCYERVGCFKDDLTWWTGILSRRLAGLPWSPEKINTRFLLYTIHNRHDHQEISAVNYSTIRASNFGTNKMTRINIPGWNTNGKWQRHICNTLLQVEDVNCINLDWLNGSLEYNHAVNNLPVVSAEVAYFVDILRTKFGYPPSKVHLIGHSLGAHLAGDAGARIPGLGRITEAYFSLDCNHARSHRFYAESILNPDAFIAYPCRSYDNFKAGDCFHCPKEGCPTMGHFADRFHLKNTTNDRPYYFLNTGTFSPFARWRHKLTIKLSGNNSTNGKLFLRVGGTIRKTGELEIASGKLKPGMTYTTFIDADVDVGNITSIEFTWKEYSFKHSQNRLGAEMVTDVSGKYGYKSTFCSPDTVDSNIPQILTPC
ncbi:PREDICTED: pancreatic lipase-related protein 3 [Chrysochloris asiatica]|uniref:Triacylglycerol lipase n=1 Tax=Chrysochloris asiatica TaxID=185453 RepID=A0A9B0SYX5_CHRAS|nr:PREDICTED: pancreatic lipase-related protein 3 [Chrysochloris asiatica]